MEEGPETGKRHGRWGRCRTDGAALDSSEAEGGRAEAAEAADEQRQASRAEASSDRRWGGGAGGRRGPASRTVYTLGTWRVSREFYLWRLEQRAVAMLIDVRGNPHSGREEELFRGRGLTKALLGAGVRYEYWGDRLGEDRAEALSDHELGLLLKGLLASAPPGPLCLFGHMHEPHKCHRLRLCDLLPADCEVEHLMWVDHQELLSLSHAEARLKHDGSVRYFMHKRGEEEQRRRQERRRSAERARGPADAADSGEHESLAAAVAAAAAAARLPVLVWQDMGAAEWAERLRDGNAYRLRLPWETELLWYPRFLGGEDADRLEETIHGRITMYHPTYRFQTPSGMVQETVNRKGQAKVCDDFTFSVQYSSRRDTAQLYNVEPLEPWSKSLLRRVEAASETVFNAIWFNHYRDGTVTIHWHTDSDEGLGPDPLIGSLSLGAARDFCLKSKRPLHSAKSARGGGIAHVTVPLFHGSLLVMGKNSQRHWLHAVPAMEGVRAERTNLTFRFYAHEDLALTSGSSGDQESGPGQLSRICLRNSKLLREQVSTEASTADEPSLSAADHASATCLPTRVRLSPVVASGDSGCLDCPLSRGLRPILIDMPDPKTTAGDLARRLCEQVLPDGVGHVRLAVRTGGGGGHQLLDDQCALSAELLSGTASPSAGQSDTHAELLLVQLLGSDMAQRSSGSSLPQRQAMDPRIAKDDPSPVEHKKTSVLPAWPGMLLSCPSDDAAVWQLLQRELDMAPPGAYLPAPGAQGLVASSGGGECWIREVLQSLSGIQRKSKGRGRLQQLVFHQSSEFVALYAGRAKSAVHLVLAPKRLIRRHEAQPADAPMIRRMAFYAAHLAQCLSLQKPGLLFAAGLRVRAGQAQQLHGHLLSMDLAAPRVGDLERQHFEDFAGGGGRFLPLHRAAELLAAGLALPSAPHDRGTSPLACHRCGQRFGDLMRQLAQHLTRCDAWPPAETTKKAGLRDAGLEGVLDEATRTLLEECAGREVALLEEMGFGSCGQEALRAALVAEGSVERAVAVLASR